MKQVFCHKCQAVVSEDFQKLICACKAPEDKRELIKTQKPVHSTRKT